MIWNEELPEKCPPEHAFEPDNLKIYRFSKKIPFEEKDFQSQRAIQPYKIWEGVDECVARSLSVYNDLDAARNLKKLPTYKKFKGILELTLNKGDGVLLKTFKDPNHYSWWMPANFNIEKSVLVS